MALLLGSAGAEGGGGLSDLEVVGQVFTFLMVGECDNMSDCWE